MNIEIRGIEPKAMVDRPLNGEVIGIGSEGCVNKFCYYMKELITLSGTKGKYKDHKIRLVSPRVPEAFTDIVTEYVKSAVETFNIESIVINDYGLLSRLHNEGVRKTPFILGRTLVRSLEYAPWSEYIVRFEEDEVQKNLLIPSIFHSAKLELLNKYNVVGTELCPTRTVGEFIPALKSKGLKVYMHYNTVIASMGRTCPVVRILGAKVGECMHLCDSSVDVKISKGWGLKQTADNSNITGIAPLYKCVGNAVYYLVNSSHTPFELCDSVIFDSILNNTTDIDFEYYNEEVMC